jgi:hypothetical protein
MDFDIIGLDGVYWIHVAKQRVPFWALVRTTMNPLEFSRLWLWDVTPYRQENVQ